MVELQKFIPFVKVDSVKREVSGIVTAEQPDKDLEVCDYAKSKPFYQALISEMTKATEGENCMPLREMHQLRAVGKGIGFHFDDTDKEIEMTFKVVDDDAWKKVEERVYTGFSQGGRKVGDVIPDPVYKGCMRYVANPSEVSLVDNPCLPSAHFAYVKLDGSVEMRKFLKTELPETDTRIAALEHEVTLLKAAGTAPPLTTGNTVTTGNAVTATVTAATSTNSDMAVVEKAKTKRVAGKDLPAADFAYVGDPEKTDTWKLPIHDKAHAKNALAPFNQTQGIPESEKARVKGKIVAAARRFGVDVASESEKKAAFLAEMRKAARVYVNKNFNGIKSLGLLELDTDLGKLRKGMCEISDMAWMLDRLAGLFCCVCNEQEWELDEESKLPEMLAGNISAITETFLAMVDEETRELLEHVQAKVGSETA